MVRTTSHRLVSSLFPFLLLFVVGGARANGLALPAQSASGAAVAAAGVAAGVNDASTVFYNAAGMTLLRFNEATFALGLSSSRLDASNAEGTDVLNSVVRGTVAGRDTINYIPSAFAVFVPGENFRLGIGITTPFGQSLAYDSQWKGRYQVQEARLQDNAFSFSAAYRASDALSLGVGVDYHRASVERISVVDFGAVCLGSLGLGTCSLLGLTPQQADGRARLDQSGDGFGYNLGLMANLKNGWRTGLTYRSSVKLNLVGEMHFDVPAAAGILNSTGAFNASIARSTFTLPESVNLGLTWDVESGTRLLFGLNWTRWSRLSSINADFDNPAQPASNEALNWRNAFRYSFGISHSLRPNIWLHAGLAYQQSPVNPAFASPLFPIGDAGELDFGLTWKLSGQTEVIVSYGYQEHQSLHYSTASSASGMLSGDLRQKFHAIGLQLVQKF